LHSERVVLDYGCGWGRIIRFFLKDIDPNNLHGIDCMPEVIELCRATNRWAQFQLVDPLPPTQIPDHSIDLIYCYSVFSHLAEEAHLQWLAEFKRILKPNGLLIATTRPRQFIVDCARVRQEARTLGNAGAASAFEDTEASLQQYDAGEFCYSPVGGGDVLDSSFYGETCIPEAYVRREWTRFFTFRTMIDDRTVCHQNVIVMQA
ncbi:MAG: class I SAM-dependent methyltransferase, partial [Herpetosiphon sp.]|nr:class I SAM-dependent methyltransferase [Herpetosiphon sp.]